MNHQIIKVLAIGLFINNLLGIISNAALTAFTCAFYGLGLIGLICFILFGSWAFQNRVRTRTHYISVCMLNIIYNSVIYAMVIHFLPGAYHQLFQCFYPHIFPLLNIILCLILLVTACIKTQTEGQIKVMTDRPDHPVYGIVRFGISFILALLILLAIITSIIFSSLSFID